MNLFFVTGGMRSIGLLFIEITQKFDASPTMTGLTVGFLGAGFGIFCEYKIWKSFLLRRNVSIWHEKKTHVYNTHIVFNNQIII